jgi:nicotinate-nucleotide pyrophosphorylase (carboxylating)
MEFFFLDRAVKSALFEDFGIQRGNDLTLDSEITSRLADVTSDVVLEDEEVAAVVFAKSAGILSGTKPFARVYSLVDPKVELSFFRNDGDRFEKGERIVGLDGRAVSIFKAERTALNFLGHLSGIATEVGRLVQLLKKSDIKLLDTRKTLPGLRSLEKAAVVHGGGVNHRMGLFDMVLLKDNHIDAVGSITEAVSKIRAAHGDAYTVEVETRNLEEVEEALETEVDRIMLDNMNRRMLKKAVRRIGGRAEIEVSGNMNRKTIRRLRKIPVQWISVGYITYAAGHSDFSLRVE